MLSTEKLLLEERDFLIREIEYLKNELAWFKEIVSKTTFSLGTPEMETLAEDMIPMNRIELPSERRARLSKKYADKKKEMQLENSKNVS